MQLHLILRAPQSYSLLTKFSSTLYSNDIPRFSLHYIPYPLGHLYIHMIHPEFSRLDNQCILSPSPIVFYQSIKPHKPSCKHSQYFITRTLRCSFLQAPAKCTLFSITFFYSYLQCAIDVNLYCLFFSVFFVLYVFARLHIVNRKCVLIN